MVASWGHARFRGSSEFEHQTHHLCVLGQALCPLTPIFTSGRSQMVVARVTLSNICHVIFLKYILNLVRGINMKLLFISHACFQLYVSEMCFSNLCQQLEQMMDSYLFPFPGSNPVHLLLITLLCKVTKWPHLVIPRYMLASVPCHVAQMTWACSLSPQSSGRGGHSHGPTHQGP